MALRRVLFERVLGVAQVPGAQRWALVALVDSVGTGLLAPITVLYFTQQVKLSLASVGLGLAVAGVAAICLTPLAGLVIDHIGPRSALVGYWLLAGASYAGYGLVHSWGAFVATASVALVADYSAKPAKQTFVTQLAQGADRVRLMAFQRSVRNAGYSVGGLLAAAALAVGGAGYLAVIYGDALSYLLAAAVILTIRGAHRGSVPAPGKPSLRDYRVVARDRRYLSLAVLDFFATFHATALTIAIPLWVALHTRAPRALVGILFTVNTTLVVLLQVRVTRRVSGATDAPPAYVRAALLFALAAGSYEAARYTGEIVAVALLVIGLLLHTASELNASTAEWTASIELAPEAHRGKYLALFSLGASLQQALGPVIITSILTAWAGGLWILLAVLMAVGTLSSAARVRSWGVDSPTPIADDLVESGGAG